MYKKIALILGSALLLGGCTLFPNQAKDAATDEAVDYGDDSAFVDSQQVTEDDSVEALETDIDNTTILEEDLSDLE